MQTLRRITHIVHANERRSVLQFVYSRQFRVVQVPFCMFLAILQYFFSTDTLKYASNLFTFALMYTKTEQKK